MSNAALQGGAGGSGTVTLLAPSTSTNRTLTLPDATDTVVGKATTDTLTNKTLLASGSNTVEATSGPGSSAFSFRNKFINGDMRIDQRNGGAAQTITAAAALAYTVDRWYGYCTGANVTGQRVAGTAPNQYNYRYTGAASVTKIGHVQRIEAANCQDLAGTTATLAVDLANSLLTTVTWTAWYANSADTFGTLASPTRTQIATGTFTVNSALTRYSTNISITAAATTGIEVEFSVGAQTSGTWTIGRVQLEAGSVATPFESRPYGTELALCQRYYQVRYSFTGMANSTGTIVIGSLPFDTMRTGPSVDGATAQLVVTDTVASFTQSTAQAALNSANGVNGIELSAANFTGLTAYRQYMLRTGGIKLSAEL